MCHLGTSKSVRRLKRAISNGSRTKKGCRCRVEVSKNRKKRIIDIKLINFIACRTFRYYLVSEQVARRELNAVEVKYGKYAQLHLCEYLFRLGQA